MTCACCQSALPALGLLASIHSACPCQTHFIKYLPCNSPDQDQRVVSHCLPHQNEISCLLEPFFFPSLFHLTFYYPNDLFWLSCSLQCQLAWLSSPVHSHSIPSYVLSFCVAPAPRFIIQTTSCTTTIQNLQNSHWSFLSFIHWTNIYWLLLECRYYARCWWTSDEQEKFGSWLHGVGEIE